MVDSWKALAEELQRWSDQDVVPTLWWRDDDAQQQTPSLQRLCELSRRFELPLSLAVIPFGAGESLMPLFDATRGLTALQHGFRHVSYARAGLRNSELGDDRPLAEVLAELAQGQQRLQQLLGARFIEVLVPPWNRLSGELSARLSDIGCRGLSTLGPRSEACKSGLRINNVHVDLINWRQGRCFAGETRVLQQLVAHLQQRRLGHVDRDEATGLMTHHLAHDAGCWQFCEQLFQFLAARPVRWLTAAHCFSAD